MKFGKRLKQHIEQSLPEWRDKFLSYKELKKLVKLISSSPTSFQCGRAEAEAEFMCLLNSEIDKFNAFFMEQEEDFVIRHKELQQRMKKVMEMYGAKGARPSEFEYKEEMGKIRKEIVNFHGEMVLLINYSNINYTGLAKILKKFDKRTGGVLRPPVIQKVLEQPFFTTELISKLVKECESSIEWSSGGELGAAVGAVAGEGIFRKTVAALVTMQEMRRESSTYGRYSLPPLNMADFDVIQSLQLLSPILIP